MHQTRPVPAHLQGQENISFSINQILSPNSEGSVMDEENACIDNPYGNYCDSKSNPSDKSRNLSNSYLYPHLGNYWGSDIYNGQYYNGCRLRDSSFYYRGLGGRNSNLYGHDYSATTLNNVHDSLDSSQKLNTCLGYSTSPGGHSKVSQTAQHGESGGGFYGFQALNAFESTSPAEHNEVHAVEAQADRTTARHFPAYTNCAYHRERDDGSAIAGGRAAESVLRGTGGAHNNDGNDKFPNSGYSGAFSASKCYGNCCNGYATAAAILSGGLSSAACGVGPLPGCANSHTATPSQATISHQAAMAAVDSAVAAVGPDSLMKMRSHRSLAHSTLLHFPWMESRRERVACK